MSKKYQLNIDAYGDELVHTDSILDALAENRIVQIRKIKGEGGGYFHISEMCDDYYGGTLSKEELKALGEEIIKLAENGC